MSELNSTAYWRYLSPTLVYSKEAQAQTLQAEIEKQKQAAENTISSMVGGMDIVGGHIYVPCTQSCGVW